MVNTTGPVLLSQSTSKAIALMTSTLIALSLVACSALPPHDVLVTGGHHRRRLRLAYIEGAEEWTRENVGRGMRDEELEGVLRRFPGR